VSLGKFRVPPPPSLDTKQYLKFSEGKGATSAKMRRETYPLLSGKPWGHCDVLVKRKKDNGGTSKDDNSNILDQGPGLSTRHRSKLLEFDQDKASDT
jgi:hypothetical protein